LVLQLSEVHLGTSTGTKSHLELTNLLDLRGTQQRREGVGQIILEHLLVKEIYRTISHAGRNKPLPKTPAPRDKTMTLHQTNEHETWDGDEPTRIIKRLKNKNKLIP
jgi:hypothetical protein